MKIALIGYGKMGRAIEEIAVQKGHEIGLVLQSTNPISSNMEKLASCDVAIEFTNPQSAPDNIRSCIDAGVPVVCGSTGWLEQWDETVSYCQQKNGTMLAASNFSIGVNIFFEVNRQLAKLMYKQEEYDVHIEEIHHTQKKDTPSGTSITIAEDIILLNSRKSGWSIDPVNDKQMLQIKSLRQDPAPGTHTVYYRSGIDDISITHTAHNRKGFAGGAVMAAEFIHGKKGIFSMKDVLGF